MMKTFLEWSNVTLPIKTIQIGNRKAYVEVAETTSDCHRGLQGRSFLLPDHGMLFDFKQDQILNFWMKETGIPLSIAFVTSEGVLTQIENLKPFDETVVSSKKKCRYAIEMSEGWFSSCCENAVCVL